MRICSIDGINIPLLSMFHPSFRRFYHRIYRPYEDWSKKAIVKLPRSSFQGDVSAFAQKYITNPDVRKAAMALTEKDYQPVAEDDQRDDQSLVELQTFFGWGTEDVEVQISSMAAEGIEATISMGDDAPLAALSAFSHTLYDYFKQVRNINTPFHIPEDPFIPDYHILHIFSPDNPYYQAILLSILSNYPPTPLFTPLLHQRFAQVTNPPIDSLREGAVMSLSMFLGPRGDVLSTSGQVNRANTAPNLTHNLPPNLPSIQVPITLLHITHIKLNYIQFVLKLPSICSQIIVILMLSSHQMTTNLLCQYQ